MSSVLSKVPIGGIFESEPVLKSVTGSNTIGEAFKVIANNNVYAVPVLEGGKCIGLIDYNDILGKLVSLIGEVNQNNIDSKKAAIKHVAKHFLDTNCKEFINYSNKNPLVTISTETSLSSVISEFTKNKESPKRIAIADGDNIVCVISPSAIVQAVTHYLDEAEVFNLLHNRTVKEVATLSVTSVNEDTTVYESLVTMLNNGKTSAAITSNGKFFSVVSIKDYKSFADVENYEELFQPVSLFVTNIRKNTPKAIYPVISTAMNSTLERVLLRFAATRIHRMFVLDDHQRVIGVISLRDILKIFA